MRWCRGDVFDGQLDSGNPLNLSPETMSMSRERQLARIQAENEVLVLVEYRATTRATRKRWGHHR